MNFKTKAFVIKSREFSETDKILTAINFKSAKITFLAKGVRRLQSKMSGYLNLFNYLDLVIYEGKNLNIVTSAEVVENFKNLEHDLKKTGVAFLMAESLDKLTQENEDHNNILSLTLECFRWLDQSDPKTSQKIIPYFLINIASKIGILPELEKCVSCNSEIKNQKNWLDWQAGGILCEKCQKNKQLGKLISFQELKLLRYHLKLNQKGSNYQRLDILVKIPDNLNKTTTDTILKFIEYNTDRKILSDSFLKKVNKII